MTTQSLVKAYIDSKQGWAIADQFNNIYEDYSEKNLCKQNINALQYIQEELNELINSDVLSKNSINDIETIYNELDTFLNQYHKYERE